ncbi:8-amino-7-oxononanoate synthase [Candidatus Poribacteria bacterium]|nr:8-amino-7-oxononanoate synthase [Candidatus Poribacteria bacterium]
MNVYDWIQTDCTELEEAGLLRHLRTVSSPPANTVTIDDNYVVMLGSNNYLGLSTHPSVVSAAASAATVYGVGASGSRLLTGNTELYTTLENTLSDLKRTEASLVFSSGYAANTSIIPVLAGEGDLILSDALNHASIIDGCRLSRATKQIYRHCDVEHLKSLLQESSGFRRRLIITDGVFSMDGDIAPLQDIFQLSKTYDAMLLVDDAHGFGVLGEKGRGTVSHCGLEGEDIIQMGTLSKAVGALGGYVSGSRQLIELLINKARGFIFTTGLPPVVLSAANTAIEIMSSTPSLRKQLLKNAEDMKTILTGIGYTILPTQTQIIPVILGDTQRATEIAEALITEDVYAPAIRPPAVPEGTSRLRVTAMATHTDLDIQVAENGFAKVWKQLYEK